METRAPYALIGSFVLAAIGAIFGFAYWLNNTGGLSERAIYRVRFENTVSGLLTGAAVLFNGIRVGEVTHLQLDPDKPREVTATISVIANTPIRADTQAGLEFQGLTGVPVVALQGGTSGTWLVAPSKSETPVLVADPAAGQSMSEAARQALRRLDSLLADNSDALHSAIGNLGTFAEALGRNANRIDGILAGLERMTGGGPKATPTIFDLTAPTAFPHPDKTAKSQLVIPEPTTLLALDTQKIPMHLAGGEVPSMDTAQWSDSIPKLVQAKVIQAFENSSYMQAVARPMDGLNADYQLLIDIRAFQVSTLGAREAPEAQVEFSAKILGENGRILASKIFSATASVADGSLTASVKALDQAFGRAATDLVVWTGSLI
jgi:phospholipid/cholesterol/gamma-HCH transport system substrate-binding protein